MELDRRSFLKGAAITGGAAALFGVAGCGPVATEAVDSNGEARSEADPILPLDPPASWDREVDLVVVGTVGGATRHALGYVIFAGGSKLQNELGAAWPGPEFDPVASVNLIISTPSTFLCMRMSL